MPFDIRMAAADPERVRGAYMRAGHSAEKADLVADLYGPEGNGVTTVWRYVRRSANAEWRFTRLAWTLPWVLMAPYGLVLAAPLARRLRRRGAADDEKAAPKP